MLRSWRGADSQPFFEQIKSDSDAMEYLPSTLSREDSDALATELQRRIDVNGWGL